MIGIVPQEIDDYAFDHTTPLPPVMEELRKATYDSAPDAEMLSDRLIGTLLQTLIRVSGAKRALEIGTFTGFSALMMAHALPEDGELITCDIAPRPLAREFFAKTPHGKKIDLRVGPALDTIDTLQGPFDLVFIDADKTNYLNYYVKCIDLLAPRGVIAVDNTLWGGKVLDPKDESDKAINALNDYVTNDPRVNNVLLTLRDGLMLAFRA